MTKQRRQVVSLKSKAKLLIGLLIAAVLVILFVVHLNRLRFPRGIVIHHSASPMYFGDTPIGAAEIDAWHAERGFETFFQGKLYHIGYHYVIRADGRVDAGLPEECRGSHAKKGNDCIGICIVGDFSSQDNPDGDKGPNEPTEEQMEALVTLCKELTKRHYFDVDSIRTHKEVDGDTECPGDSFPFKELTEELKGH